MLSLKSVFPQAAIATEIVDKLNLLYQMSRDGDSEVIMKNKVNSIVLMDYAKKLNCERKIKEIIPSNSFVPASAGLLITSYIINDIVGDLIV